ncbi:LPXTG-site transpeptidase (sortase) family protein [Granulicatella balaenopterae]|uniref:LPXTG-site transpeptidase (Sortase) family protein n=1 Tax=Granulicatella balaenopterae TaxID=137733 RepID=A0A1H9HPU3_9LACT|nr:class C sortase [Granulicatella balaenopterae]SEQ64361.1 LPXTG-site transpeptidase (sortase) family protein [Granulicatella balaenopterae]
MKRKEKQQKKRKKWPYAVIFFLGLMVLLYPLVSQYYYRIEAQNQLVEFEKSVSEMDESEIIKRMDLARAYNAVLDPTRLADPYTDKEKEGIAEYARMLEVEEKLGFIEIPSIDCKIPIYAGTKESVLQKGAGHLEGTSLPIGGDSTHTVITAHRGLPTAELFTHLDKVKKGDVFYIHNLETVLAYEVDQILTVEPSDFDPVLVTEGQDYATLLTCTPYMINSHRLLVRGHRIPYVAPVDDGVAISRSLNDKYKDYIVFEVLIVGVLLAIVLYTRHDALRKKKIYLELERKARTYGEENES